MQSTRRPIRILLLEDDADDHYLMCDSLKEVSRADFDITWASDFSDGLKQLKDSTFDVCVVDYRLGALTGIDFIHEAYSIGSQCSFVVWTGSDARQIELDALEAGATALIDKYNFRSEDLARVISFASEQINRRNNFNEFKNKKRNELNRSIRHAIRRHEFEALLQPQVRCSDMRITGAELLVRWNKPGQGVVGPQSFLDEAENSGAIIEIGKQVLEQACEYSRNLSYLGRKLRLAVNVSVVQLERPGFVETVEELLHSNFINPSLIELELTESTAMSDPETVLLQMNALKEIGLSFSIDDFGTGFSGLTTLRNFPFDCIKIDRSFFCKDENYAQDAELTSAIFDIAKRLDLETVSEGVETDDQLRFVVENGGTHVQGFLFSKPVSFDQFVRLLDVNFELLKPRQRASL